MLCHVLSWLLVYTGFKKKPNDCVVFGAMLHELCAHQCHTRPKVFFLCHGFLWFWKGIPHSQKHTTWWCGMHRPYIPHDDTYQILYYVVCQQHGISVEARHILLGYISDVIYIIPLQIVCFIAPSKQSMGKIEVGVLLSLRQLPQTLYLQPFRLELESGFTG